MVLFLEIKMTDFSHALARTQTQQTHTPDLVSGCGELRVIYILHLLFPRPIWRWSTPTPLHLQLSPVCLDLSMSLPVCLHQSVFTRLVFTCLNLFLSIAVFRYPYYPYLLYLVLLRGAFQLRLGENKCILRGPGWCTQNGQIACVAMYTFRTQRQPS